jgi:adenosylcobinamide kinase/adenosylcobinamide-phosphate guanylyltransferase
MALQTLLANLTLITGGARSGKSSFAEVLASERSERVAYIATMEELSSDPESVERIRRHRERRPPTWLAMEKPLFVHEAVATFPEEYPVCIIDCLSLYVSNLLLKDVGGRGSTGSAEASIDKAGELLLGAIGSRSSTHFIVVTNEVGWGIVPENDLARIYRDLLGVTNQRFARAARHAWLCCAGLQLKLKPSQSAR